MTDSTLSDSSNKIPSVEADTTPEAFRDGPASAIIAAVNSTPSVQLVLKGAQLALSARADVFTQEVGVRAVEVAGARGASAVDVPDITAAAEELYPARRAVNPWAWAVLGIVAGAILSFLVSLLVPVIAEEWKAAAAIIALVLLLGCIVWAVLLIRPKKST